MYYYNERKNNRDYSEETLRGKTLLIINTGSFAKRFIFARIKELGIRIVCLNREKNWAEPFVDYWIISDTYNHEVCIKSIHRFLRRYPHIIIQGASTFWEDDIPLLARICEEFDYIGNNSEAARNTRNKFDMQEVLREKRRPFIAQFLLYDETYLHTAIRFVGFPAVIKPQCGSDSQYVVYVRNQKEAYTVYSYIHENCIPTFDPIYRYNERKFLYQQFIEGQEFSIEGYVQNGIPNLIGIHEKTKMNLPFFIETGDYCPAKINEEKRNMLMAEAKAALLAMKVTNSLVHIEIKDTKKGPIIIEIASRMGGVYIYQSIKQVYGFDLIQAACEIALGIKITETSILPQKCLFAKFFIPTESGIITDMRGFDTLKDFEGFVDCFISKKRYDNIRVPPEGYETLGWVITEGHSHNQAEHRMDRIMNHVRWTINFSENVYLPEKKVFLSPISLPVLSRFL